MSNFKKSIIIILLVNTLIVIFNEGNALSIYSPKKVFLKSKNVLKSFLTDLDILKQTSFNHNNEIRFFKKSIVNGEVSVKEIYNYSTPMNFFNISQDDFILNKFSVGLARNFIFYNPKNPNYPLNLLNLISLLVVHGNEDNATSYREKLDIIKKRPLSLTCTPGSEFLKRLLDSKGIKNRVVLTLTLENWNSYDNGHTLLEVFSENLNKWFLYDIDGQKVFKNSNGVLLNLIELQQLGVENVNIVPVSNQPFLDYGGFKEYSLIGEFIEANPKNWYARVFQVFSIQNIKDGKYVFLTNNNLEIQKVSKYYNDKASCLDYDSFKNYFYEVN